MAELIRVDGLYKAYCARDGTEVEALHDVSFTVDRGEFVAMVAHSGCVKSTLLKILGGASSRGVVACSRWTGRRSTVRGGTWAVKAMGVLK